MLNTFWTKLVISNVFLVMLYNVYVNKQIVIIMKGQKLTFNVFQDKKKHSNETAQLFMVFKNIIYRLASLYIHQLVFICNPSWVIHMIVNTYVLTIKYSYNYPTLLERKLLQIIF